MNEHESATPADGDAAPAAESPVAATADTATADTATADTATADAATADAATADTPVLRATGHGLWKVARIVLVSALTGVLAVGVVVTLLAGGLYVAPTYGIAAYVADEPPRRSPIVPPSVPLGAREDWATWSYVDKISQAWGKDWPLVIQWFEELDARYPGNPMVLDKLYVSYLEDGRRLREAGDLDGARIRYEQASRYDPDRGVAQALLDELDELEDAGR